jgi:uncharacterized protein with HEPN domain
MPLPKGAVRLRHMMDHAREAVALVQNKKREDLEADRKLNLALVRLLEIIGEAAGRISKDDRTRYPNVPWTEIVGLRNRLIHGYDEIDFDIVWQIVTADLPTLIENLEGYLKGKG